jgi:hypothetical protein
MYRVKYYKFNRHRPLFDLHRYVKYSLKKTNYMANTGRSKLLPSLYYENETWGALHKAWKGYLIGKDKDEYDKMEYYASVIQKLQDELGLPISSFPNVGVTALKFYASKYESNSNCNNNNPNNHEENVDTYESRLADDEGTMKEEILSDDNTYGEYFADDFNGGDRFTS